MNLKEISRDTRLPAAEIHPYRHFKFVDKRLGYKVQNADNSDEQREGEEVLVSKSNSVQNMHTFKSNIY